MVSIKAAIEFVSKQSAKNLSPVRQVSPGSVVVNIMTGEIAICCMVELGEKWCLFNIKNGHIVGHMFDADQDTRNGLPIDGFGIDPKDHIVFCGGKISNDLANCQPLKTAKK